MKNLIYLFSLLLLINSCAKNDDESEKENQTTIKIKVQEDSIKVYTPEERLKLIEKYEMERDKTQTQIIMLEELLAKTKGNQKEELEKRMVKIYDGQSSISRQIIELKGSTKYIFPDLKIKLDSSITRLDSVIKYAKKEFE